METPGETCSSGVPRPRGTTDGALCGLLLAGGKSSRMGRDKASLVVAEGGLSQAGRALGLLRQFCPRTYLSLRDGQDIPVGAEGALVLRDEPDSQGPLAGLLAASRAEPEVAWLVLACDLPFVHAGLLARLVSVHERKPDLPFVACANRRDGAPEPLCAIYGPSAGPILARYAARGEFSPRRIMIEEKAVSLEVIGEDVQALINVNNPQDLAAARAMAKQR